MKEKILALLTAKFAGVRKDGLARLAGALALNATTEDEAGALVEKLTAEAVTGYITDYRKDVDTEVSTATKTHETTLKKKYNIVDKDPEPGKAPANSSDDEEKAPAWAKALIEQNKQLAEKVAAFEGSKKTETRLQQLESKLTNVPAAIKAKALKDFKRMTFETEEAFAEYLTEVDTDITALNQELAERGFESQSAPVFGKPGTTEDDAFVENLVAINKTESK